MKRWTALLTAGLCLTLTAPAVQADHGRPVVVLGGPVAVARPAYRPYVVDLAPAPVVRVREPRQECWDEVVRYPASGRTESATPTILGGIVGGVVGHEVGSGRSQGVATMAGALLGASIGQDLTPRTAGGDTVEVVERRCRTVYSEYDAVVAEPRLLVRPARHPGPRPRYYR